MQMPAQEFQDALGMALGSRFAPFELAGERFIIPLRRAINGPATRPDTVRLGNAAQTLHPVAGQGLNLGLRDAFETSEIIASAQTRTTTSALLANEIVAQRNTDRKNTVRLTDLLAQLDKQLSWTGVNNSTTQSIVIGLLDTIGPLRRLATKRFVFGHRKAN